MFLGKGVYKVFVCARPIDLRKSFNGLCGLVQEVLALDPLTGHLFVFFNKRYNNVKALYWERDGFCIWQKKLQRGQFARLNGANCYAELDEVEFRFLIEGIDLRQVKRRPAIEGKMVA